MNGLHNVLDVPGNKANVPADRSHLDPDGIDQFLCFPDCPTDLQKNRNKEEENHHQNDRNHYNADFLEYD
jgi:hypothetical protein